MSDNALRPISVLAEMLLCSEKTARRRLSDAMAADPGLHVIRRGRTILFTEQQLQRVVRALEWRSTSANVARSTTLAARSASGGRSSTSPSSAQERVRALTQKLSRAQKKPSSARSGLTVLPGGRDASR